MTLQVLFVLMFVAWFRTCWFLSFQCFSFTHTLSARINVLDKLCQDRHERLSDVVRVPNIQFMIDNFVPILFYSLPRFSASKKRPSSPSTNDVPSKKPKTLKKKSSVPLNQILKGVTIVLSGYQNPLRGVIRDKALEMGAKYKPDWDATSTHLICAFSNTPKFTQVRISSISAFLIDTWRMENGGSVCSCIEVL